ncbi:DUF2809 domain-containing protein [Kitasatospora sp. NPDC088346]|uniref:ribosomal maturation YjgA family protein n=1 Tax=Kitasatospora sp. NPDC088346 TaxID=3364073 RepID=UPI0038190726
MDDQGVAGARLRARSAALGAAAVTVAAGLAVRAGLGEEFAKPAGDALYTVLVHTLVVLAAPRARPRTAAAVALGLSWAVEFLQLTGIPAESSRHSTAARLVLGSTFNPPDLFWYAVGAAFACAAHTGIRTAHTAVRAARAPRTTRPAPPP